MKEKSNTQGPSRVCPGAHPNTRRNLVNENAIDAETKQITFDFTNMVQHVLGYEPGPISPDEFVAREERMEKEFLEKSRRENIPTRGYVVGVDF